MKNLLLGILIAGLSSSIAMAQTAEPEKDTATISMEWEQALDEMELTLEKIEIPRIDVDSLVEEVRKGNAVKRRDRGIQGCGPGSDP